MTTVFTFTGPAGHHCIQHDQHSPWTRVSFLTPVFTGRRWTRPVDTGSMHPAIARSQVYRTERPPYLFAARSPWCSSLRGIVSDSWSLFPFTTIFLQPKFYWSNTLFLLTNAWRRLLRSDTYRTPLHQIASLISFPRFPSTTRWLFLFQAALCRMPTVQYSARIARLSVRLSKWAWPKITSGQSNLT